MQIDEIMKGLQAVANKNTASNLGKVFLRNLKAEDVSIAIRDNVSLVKLCFNEWHLSHGMVKPFAKIIVKSNFKDVEDLLTDVPKVYEILSENPKILPLLNTMQGRIWLNKQCKDLYTALYMYAWTDQDPLEANGFKNPYKNRSVAS